MAINSAIRSDMSDDPDSGGARVRPIYPAQLEWKYRPCEHGFTDLLGAGGAVLALVGSLLAGGASRSLFQFLALHRAHRTGVSLDSDNQTRLHRSQ
jgi:hypothetical protein